ncbi:MAG: hypothetical protein AB1715_05250 [Acidobacteriota bacterium]
MKIFYHLIVFYFTLHLGWHLFREKKAWSQLSTVLVLILFLLRFFLVK